MRFGFKRQIGCYDGLIILIVTSVFNLKKVSQEAFIDTSHPPDYWPIPELRDDHISLRVYLAVISYPAKISFRALFCFFALILFPLGFIVAQDSTDHGSTSFSAESMVEDMLIELQESSSRKESATLYTDIAFAYKMIGKNELALAYVDSGMALSQALGYTDGIARAHEHYAAIYFETGELERALTHLRQELKICQSYGQQSNCGSVFYHIGTYLQDYGRSYAALDTMAIAINLLKTEEQWTHVGSCYNTIASIHRSLGNQEEALENINVALEFKSSELRDRSRALILGTKAELLIRLERIGEAKATLEEAKLYCKENDFEKEAASLLQVEAELLMKQGKFESAITLLEDAQKRFSAMSTPKPSLYNHILRSKCYEQTGNRNQAILMAEKGLEFIDWNEEIHKERDLYVQLSLLYESEGDASKALLFLQKRDSVEQVRLQMAQLKQTRDLESRFRHEQQKVALLEKENELSEQNLKLVATENRSRLFGLGLLAVFLIAALGFFWFKQRQKHRDQIAKTELNQALIESTEEERERIARELHDGTGSLLTGIKLSLDQLHLRLPDNRDKSGLALTINQVQDVAKEVRRVSHAMAPATIDRLKFEKVLIDLFRTFSHIGTAEITQNISGDLDSMNKTERLMLYRILQECLNNSFKHADASLIEISISALDDQIELIYKDNGNGYDTSTAKIGIGLSSIDKRIRYLNGHRQVETEPGLGMLLIVNFPILRS